MKTPITLNGTIIDLSAAVLIVPQYADPTSSDKLSRTCNFNIRVAYTDSEDYKSGLTYEYIHYGTYDDPTARERIEKDMRRINDLLNL